MSGKARTIPLLWLLITEAAGEKGLSYQNVVREERGWLRVQLTCKDLYVCRCMCMYVHVCAHACRSQKSASGVLQKVSIPFPQNRVFPFYLEPQD